MEIDTVKFSDVCTELQDDALDAQFEWLNGLPVTDEVRWEVFEHLCKTTGALLNKVIALRLSQGE